MVDERDSENAPELDALHRWGADWLPPAELRGETLVGLRRAGLLGRQRDSLRVAPMLWSVAAAAVVFVAFLGGLAMGHRTASASLTDQKAGLYMLLLYESADYRSPATPEEARERVKEYGDWARKTAAGGRFVDGNELGSDGRWCRATSGGIEAATPVLDPERGKLAGYFMIGAASLDEAQVITGHCPHFRHGGTVEIRPIVGP